MSTESGQDAPSPGASETLSSSTPSETTTNAPAAADSSPASDGVLTSADPELKDFLANKGFKTSDDLARSYRNLEKVFGADKAGRTVVLPREGASTEELDAFYSKLGRPAQPEEYDFGKLDNADERLMEWAPKTFHELGLSQDQAKKLVEAWQGKIGDINDQVVQQQRTDLEAEDQALRREWGNAYEAKLESARQAVQAFGVKPEVLDAMEKQQGYSDVLRTWADVGAKLFPTGDYLTGDSKGGFTAKLSPADALKRMDELKNDPEWAARYRNNPKGAERREMEALTRAATGSA